jgi:ABC-type Fe3+-hydroxamate transport system substrate-binding protein
MYAMQEGAKDAVSKLGHQYTGLCTYTNTDYTYGNTGFAGEFFRILNIKNVYTPTTNGEWSGENVVMAQPEFILFITSDPSQVNWDQAMRVSGSTSA